MEILRATLERDQGGLFLKVIKFSTLGDDPLVPYEDTAPQIVLAAKVENIEEARELASKLGVELETPL